MQNIKKTNKPKCSKLPIKEVETISWAEVYIDLIGPYTVEYTKNRCQVYSNNVIINSNNVYWPY